MKVKLLFLGITSLLTTAIFAQGFKVGVKGGATINKLSGQSFKDQFSFGYHVGGFATIGLTPKLSIQPEVLFNQINVDTSSSFSTVYQFNKLNKAQLKYLTIPVLLNYNTSKLLSLQLGPQFGILMNKDKTFVQNGKNAFKSGDLSMLGGVQLNLTKLKIYGRYAIGLSNINDIDNKEKWTNQSIQVGLGLVL
jgi:hypothetical protein